MMGFFHATPQQRALLELRRVGALLQTAHLRLIQAEMQECAVGARWGECATPANVELVATMRAEYLEVQEAYAQALAVAQRVCIPHRALDVGGVATPPWWE